MLKRSKIVLVSFADSKYVSATERLRKETETFGFDERYFFSEKDLPRDFFKGFSPKLYRRGYGYWSWKPYLIDKVLKTLQDGDIVVYSDCGNRWCDKSMGRFKDYLDMLNVNSPFVVFQQQYLEKDWTKGDVFHYVCKDDWKKYAVTLQLWCGCFLLMKSQVSSIMVSEWLDIALKHRDLISDKKSVSPNMGTFQENRHDQSVFSLLVKQLPHTEISWKEVDDLDGTWVDFGNYPIQARREHKTSRKSWLLNRVLLRPYRYLQGLYLIVFKDFYFRKKIAWTLTPIIGQFMSLFINWGGGKRHEAYVCSFSREGGQTQ